MSSCAFVSVFEEMNPACRETMEDTYRIIDGYENIPSHGFFAVYDGHGGRDVSLHLHAHLDKTIARELSDTTETNMALIMTRAYLYTDIQCCQSATVTCGATAVTCVIRMQDNQRLLHTANVGDSRAVLARKNKALRLSKDHKAEESSEMERIRLAGGAIVKQRVMGILAVTRSFGDLGLKKYVTARPFTSTVRLSQDDTFLIIACDGIWDVMQDQEAVDFVRRQGTNNTHAAKLLVEEAMRRKSTDNLTCLIVYL